MQVIVDSLLTSYVRKGKGPTVVLLHGWGDNSHGFATLIGELSKSYDVIALDLPGFGGSKPPAKPWDLTDYAMFVAAFIKKIGVKEVLAYVGHSNGGAIAVRGLGTGNIEASKLILVGCAGIRGVYKGRLKALRIAAKAGKALAAPLPKSVKQRLRKQAYAIIGSDMLVAEHLQETFKKVVGDDVRADAQKISQPTLLIYGEQDTATPVTFGEMYHQLIKNSTLEVLAGAGHFVHQERSEEVNKRVKEFLQ